MPASAAIAAKPAKPAEPSGAGPDRSLASAVEPVNEVHLIGRLAAAAEERELPSGDVLVLWRVIVDRPPPARARASGDAPRLPTVDTIDCAASLAGPRRSALSWQPGDVVSVQGTLRRRFWRGAAGLGSRYEVEAKAVRRVARAAAEARRRSRAG